MQLTSKLDLGQKVWWIREGSTREWTPCGFCDANGYIIGANGIRKPCPVCYGAHGHYEHQSSEWKVRGNGHIGQIKAIIHDYNIEYTQNDRPEDSVEYMLRETGIVCGSYYYEKELFATEEEAQAACDERNKEVRDV